jgi:hypothetical protein
MNVAIHPLPQYAFMVWCSVEAQGQLYLFNFYFPIHYSKLHFKMFPQYMHKCPKWLRLLMVSNQIRMLNPHAHLVCQVPRPYHIFIYSNNIILKIQVMKFFLCSHLQSFVTSSLSYSNTRISASALFSNIRNKFTSRSSWLRRHVVMWYDTNV